MKHPISRARPGFQLFTPPVPPVSHTLWSNPNVRVMGCSQLDQFASDGLEAPGAPVYRDRSGPVFRYSSGPNDYVRFVPPNPRLTARRLAQFFEYQGFTTGAPAETTPVYEGSACVLGIGDTLRNLALNGVPTLMTHAMDAVAGDPSDDFEDGQNGANCWYNAKGVEAVAAWADDFFAILKEEFDNPASGNQLYYPAHFAFDLEYALPYIGYALIEENLTGADHKWGWWWWAVEDDRSATEVLLDPAQTSETTFTAIASAAPSVTINKAWWDTSNQPFSSWFAGVSISIVSYAMQRAIYTKVKEYFPGARVSNYGTYLADTRARWNPGPNGWMASKVLYLNEDSQAPDLYGVEQYINTPPTTPNPRKLAGETDRMFWRRANLQAIEAVVYSTNRLPVTPWIQAPGSYVRGYAPDLFRDRGDFRWMLRSLARHGVHEYLVFADANASSERLDELSRQIEKHCAEVYPGNPAPMRWFWRA